MFKLISATHATVKSTVKDLQENGFELTSKPEKGDIVVWEEQTFREESHTHIGFWWNETTAISNSDLNGFPILHSLDFNGTRKISQIFHRAI